MKAPRISGARLATALVVLLRLAAPARGAGAIETFERRPAGQPAAWVVGSVLTGYTNPAYCPIFLETFDEYAPGPLGGQGAWIRNDRWGKFSPRVAGGEDQLIEGDAQRGWDGTAASCFFPDLFADGNTAGRIEFDFRRGNLEFDFAVGPSVKTGAGVSNVADQCIGGQFSVYGDGCFTPRYNGAYHGPQIVHHPWKPDTFYHMVIDLAKTGDVVTVHTTIDGARLDNLSGLRLALTAPQGINSLTVRGADHRAPTYAVDNVVVSVPSKPGGMPVLPWTQGP